MDAGSLNKRITLQRKVTTKGPAGGVQETWENLTDTPEVWARKVDRSGVQTTESGQTISKVTSNFRIRYRTDVEPSMRVLFNSRPYNILYVLDLDGMNDFLELMCETGANNG
ncbi:MAG TPA: phage head closure protein [Limnobacter sp.]|uniref:phage head closure protein n=1 Tax=Limnobacter sp. TaxID=2003368 RepID=UPI002E36369C|nr:phage head closure protein [Limnobacter sp.]HEX5486501.1 phage head closure protein [Limnobacter sp.]